MTARFLRSLAVLAGTLTMLPLAQAEFAVAISPPRFELQGRPAQVLRQTMEITNAAPTSGNYRLRTADWVYAANGTVEFLDDISPGSCRPWVALERRELTVGPGRPYRFRFEVTPPADAPSGECRFAIMVEGQEETTTTGPLTVPFNARMAVIVYVAVGGAQPQLAFTGETVIIVNGLPTPALQVRNEGNAHGRIAGFLQGADASGTKLEFTPATSPILPGETRTIPLLPARPGDPDAQVVLRYPVTVKGRIEWGKGQTQDIDLRLGP
jgi:P pilus assembly chaperone PapD